MEEVQPKRINICKPVQVSICKSVSDSLNDLVFDKTWENLKCQVYAVGYDILGFKLKKHQNLFDSNNALIDELMVKKCMLHLTSFNQRDPLN